LAKEVGGKRGKGKAPFFCGFVLSWRGEEKKNKKKNEHFGEKRDTQGPLQSRFGGPILPTGPFIGFANRLRAPLSEKKRVRDDLGKKMGTRLISLEISKKGARKRKKGRN